MEYAELETVLKESGNILVHFLEEGAVDPPCKGYPEGLRRAIKEKKQNSFSTVGPSDAPHHWGKVGAVGIPNLITDITGICFEDGGTIRGEDGVIIVVRPEDRIVTAERCRLAISESSGTYNEWVFAEYKVAGIFVFEEHLCMGFQPNLERLQMDFAGQRIFSQGGGKFVEISDDGNRSVVVPQDIYRF